MVQLHGEDFEIIRRLLPLNHLFKRYIQLEAIDLMLDLDFPGADDTEIQLVGRIFTRAGRCWGKPQNSDKMTCAIHLSLEPGEVSLCASHYNSSFLTMTVTKRPSPISSPSTRTTSALSISG